MNQQVSDIAREVDLAFMLIGGVSLMLVFGITAAMALIVLKYRRGKNPTTTQIEGHVWLEITWIVIPTIIVTWMFFVGYKGFVLMRNPPADAMEVKVTGRRWAWSFEYPDAGVSSTEMTIPVNTAVKAVITAAKDDVIHSFFIPDFRVKQDAVPGMETFLWIEPERTGDYNIFCAEFCGKDHSKMLSMLHVVTQEEFEAWIKAQIKKKYKPLEFAGVTDPDHPAFGPEDLNIDAEQLYGGYCRSCHGAKGDGSGLPGVARDFSKIKEWKKTPKVTDIYVTLMEGVDKTQMRPYPNFTPWERVALAHKVRTFIKDGLPADTEETYASLIKKYELDKMKGPKETIPIKKAMDLLANEAKAGNDEPAAK